MKFEHDVVVVTGASSGIGEGVAKHFLNEGAKVVGCGIEDKMNFTHKNLVYIKANLVKPDDAYLVIKKAIDTFERINKVICVAGVTYIGSMENTSYESFTREIEINLGSVFNICKASIIELKKQKNSTIITVGSNLGARPIPERIGYCPSKAAVSMLTKCMAQELAPCIRVNGILPGMVRTPMTESRFQEAEDPKALEESYASLYLPHRMGTIDDMVNAISFLSSDESSFITGEMLAVCGGALI